MKFIKIGAAVAASLAGLVVVVVSILAYIASFFPFTSWLAPFDKLLEESGVIGGAAVLIGVGLVWINLHTWVVYLCIVGGCVALAGHCLSSLGRGPLS